MVFCRCPENTVLCLWEGAEEKTPPETQAPVRGCDLAQGHVLEVESCHKTKVSPKQSQDLSPGLQGCASSGAGRMLPVTPFCALKVWHILTSESIHCFQVRNSTSPAASSSSTKDKGFYSSHTCTKAVLSLRQSIFPEGELTKHPQLPTSQGACPAQEEQLLCLPLLCAL